MAVPQQRKSKSRRDMRRAHHDVVTPPNVTKCPKCDEPKLSHRPCTYCGDYHGREVLVIEEKKD